VKASVRHGTADSPNPSFSTAEMFQTYVSRGEGALSGLVRL